MLILLFYCNIVIATEEPCLYVPFLCSLTISEYDGVYSDLILLIQPSCLRATWISNLHSVWTHLRCAGIWKALVVAIKREDDSTHSTSLAAGHSRRHRLTENPAMDFCFATFAALFLLFGAASCAPALPGLQDACADVRNSSLELNHAVKNAVNVSFYYYYYYLFIYY